ncbi:MAG TPA: CPBP family intramembrane glutamic endopeptidase [Caulobacteraceae bacterium]|nr:CPBP family intramembrane glutamic endopeptidase [Caulobacteraceae bacterium]
MTESAFLAGIDDRERDAARLLTTLVGGLVLGLVAATCGMLLVMVAYAILIGEGTRGAAVLAEIARAVADPQAMAPGLSVLRLVLATAVDGVFLVVFVAVAAVIMRRTLHTYVTAAPRVRWRLLGVAMALAAAAMAPVVMAEHLLIAGGAAPPVLGVSPMPGDRLAYALSALLLLPAAAAEELFFRGWLLRQTGAFLRRPAILIGVTSVLFSAMHLDFNPDAFLTRALMGAGLAYMTLRLGGIEFAAGVHAVNNMLIVLFLQPLSLQQTEAPDISAFSLFEDIALIGGYVLITELVARVGPLRRLAGVRLDEVSRPQDFSAHFS